MVGLFTSESNAWPCSTVHTVPRVEVGLDPTSPARWIKAANGTVWASVGLVALRSSHHLHEGLQLHL